MSMTISSVMGGFTIYTNTSTKKTPTKNSNTP
jgi:hypothetical protein